jgi:hypothetical protein
VPVPVPAAHNMSRQVVPGLKATCIPPVPGCSCPAAWAATLAQLPVLLPLQPAQIHNGPHTTHMSHTCARL